MTKIDIISGFLGAGKTTFIKKMLEEAFTGEQVVLIENEFGEIGIDGGFLKESGIEIREMNSGCICCSLVGDFGKSLQEVVAAYHPDRIIIEPSGVGKLSDVMKAVRNVQDDIGVCLNSFTTIVDAKKYQLYLDNFGEFYSNQVEHAGAIIMSRTDTAKPETIQKCQKQLRELNEKAPIITTPISQLNGLELLEILEGGPSLQEKLMKEVAEQAHHHEHHHVHGDSCGCGHHHDHNHDHHHAHGESCGCGHHHDHNHDHHHAHGESCGCGHHHDHEHGHHHAEDVFTSWGCETSKFYTDEEITHILQTLESDVSCGRILRAKGMVAGGTEWIYFDMVPEEHEVRHGAAEYTGRICVIGSALNEARLAELFGV